MATASENIEDEVEDPISFREQGPQPYIFLLAARQCDPTDQQRQRLNGDRQERVVDPPKPVADPQHSMATDCHRTETTDSGHNVL
ncbi:UNVERIFIED_CONTAM: hypothetical protein FKN15_077622 [Acipenser sinensis]